MEGMLSCTKYVNNTPVIQVVPYENISQAFCSNLTDIHINGTEWSDCECISGGYTEHVWFPFYTQVLSCIFFGLIFLFGTLGNGVVLAILAVYEKVSQPVLIPFKLDRANIQ